VNGAVGLLLETERDYGDDTDAALRHALHMISVETVWRWHYAHLNAVKAAVQSARASAASVTDPIVLLTGTDTTGPTVDPVPAGYFLSAKGLRDTAVQRNLFRIYGVLVSGGYYVPTDQAARTVIAYLFDPKS